ncbi:hypothetical protein [Acinetobacter venetianus]|uniref:hypothetical protein n=1 Tax=Acinetobacter venetianus TaxID=52133 RepID=UPI00077866AD|nr:hypothetical protein [Acinetobacter venetianus]KXZ65125.1 hypothetical protein AVENLUH7437_01541 [Acinetobacter venetianus]
MTYLLVDGMYGGTGIRNKVEGGYLNISDLNISLELQQDISNWLEHYADAHFTQYSNKSEIAKLDKRGIEICKKLREELPNCKIDYFSDALMQKLYFD